MDAPFSQSPMGMTRNLDTAILSLYLLLKDALEVSLIMRFAIDPAFRLAMV
jgi:hypothetical protein